MELIGTAGAHFRDGAVDFSGRGSAAAEIQRAWDNLAHSQPKAVYNKKLGKSRLVVTKLANDPRADTLAAEILAVGVGVSVAIRFYDIMHRFLSARITVSLLHVCVNCRP